MSSIGSKSGRVAFQFAQFDGFELTHGMSGRRLSAPAEGQVAHARGTVAEVVEQNRTSFLTELGIEPSALTLGRQVHGTRIQIVTTSARGRGQYPAFDGFPATDGLVTAEPEAALGIIISDCTPLLVYDPAKHVIGLAHAGWRGTVAGIGEALVLALVSEFGSAPQDLVAGIGPSIGPCCYEVGDEVIAAWRDLELDAEIDAVVPRIPRAHFDLWTANRIVLESAGLDPQNIFVAGLCTRCEGERFFSHRAAVAGERPRGSMIMVAQLH